MEPIFEAILGLGGTVAYGVIALLAFGEAAAFVGLVLPGEIAVVLGGVLASQGRVSLPLLLVVVAVAFGLAGYLAGESYHYIESATGWGSWILTGLVVAGFGSGWIVRRRRRARPLAGRSTGPDNCEKPSGDGSSDGEIPAWNVSAASDDASDTGATGVANQAVMT